MSFEAALWRPDIPRAPLDEVLEQPHFARYVSAWGRSGDAAMIAEDERGTPIGAAWYRLFPRDYPGFGFIDERTPELSIAVRGDRAQSHGLLALSLSVRRDNPAVRLYERAGFGVVTSDANTFTMRLDLPPRR